ncbi:Gfo/Idh/MocA family oxidoreductase [Chloroflexi bacterium TSY]|nr:Gfo/Idh/MocA family oxidoreductase [Chloroflexi bacterium TSY]
MSKNMINIGVIGTGGMGGHHVRNLTHEVATAQVIALMDVDKVRMNQVAQESGASYTFSDADELIHHADVDAILIAAPDRFHAALTLSCIEAGKPVLCEKPLATSAAEAHKVIEAEVAGGQRMVQLGFMREYDPAHVDVKRIIDSGDLGKPLAFRGVHINPTQNMLRTVEDVITNSVIHDIHSARWMMGDEVESVYTNAIPSAQERPDTARFVLVQLQYRNGALGQIECNSESGYGYEVEVKMTGETGSVQTNSFQSSIVNKSNQRSQWITEDWLQRFDMAYKLEGRAWVQSIIDGVPTGPSAWDGYIAMIIADACIESAKSGLPQNITIPERPPIY